MLKCVFISTQSHKRWLELKKKKQRICLCESHEVSACLLSFVFNVERREKKTKNSKLFRREGNEAPFLAN
jgi:hypothetical protein